MILMLIVLLTTTPVFPNILYIMTRVEHDNISKSMRVNEQYTQYPLPSLQADRNQDLGMGGTDLWQNSQLIRW